MNFFRSNKSRGALYLIFSFICLTLAGTAGWRAWEAGDQVNVLIVCAILLIVGVAILVAGIRRMRGDELPDDFE